VIYQFKEVYQNKIFAFAAKDIMKIIIKAVNNVAQLVKPV